MLSQIRGNLFVSTDVLTPWWLTDTGSFSSELKQAKNLHDHRKFSAIAKPNSDIQLFRERLSYIRGKAHGTMSKVIMDNGFYGCLSEPQGVERNSRDACIDDFSFLVALLLNHLKPQSSKA